MAGYETITMSTTTPNDILRLSAQGAGHMVPMDVFDHDLNFGEPSSMFAHTRDDLSSNVPSLPFTPSYELSDAFSSTFDDPFSYQSAQFDTLLEPNNDTQQGETPSQALDNKLLGFGAPIMKVPILDDRGQTWPQMTAELYGMFFVAEDVFGGETTGRPMELTCYRRNLFQISGSMVLSRSISHVLNEQGQQVPLYDLTASISALESIEGKSTEIISVPWKTSAGSASEDKAGAAPAKWPLDLSINPELDPATVTIPIAWKRLQFKHATANNGRRKGLQQHYVIQINLMATTATGEVVKLAEIQSGPIIVRGRSPRNFDSRKDVPLSEKKLDSKQKTTNDVPQTPQVKVDPGVTNSSYRFYTNQSQSLDIPDWTNGKDNGTSTLSPETSRPAKKAALSAPVRPPIPKTRWSSESKSTLKKTSQASPIDLSLADDEYGRKDSTGHGGRPGDRSPEMRKKSGAHVGSPVENADLLYEYFPLSLDDWMPPVDAIYRPHVVHHIHPPEMMAQQVKGKQKRYFSADD
ncbi:p53-like transcription factor [Glarea lozoyensis ATCC 20868]|uniref:p53-like transcription factor n=1 Tax=Glarea lozoyensis (strain ATCC 20868 / MF5171) TaxID=1116229 RepID=S3CTA9_GLAL2|nr:p53-like transcription factor [Glarea lozoyensis ATCC 20868]EPE28880.1 p53-like transcription factor [Glarea lozoyensis ATCC 20868]